MKPKKRDYTELIECWKRRADDGDLAAQYSLGCAYCQDDGVTQNFVLAYMWFSLAARASWFLDVDHAAHMRDLVGAALTPDELAEAERLVRERKPIKMEH